MESQDRRLHRDHRLNEAGCLTSSAQVWAWAVLRTLSAQVWAGAVLRTLSAQVWAGRMIRVFVVKTKK